MERLTDKKEADAQRQAYEKRLKNGYPRNIQKERFLKLAAYEDTELSPETVSDLLERFMYFYRTVEGLDIVDPVHFGAFVDRVKRWQQAEQDGRLVVLPCKVGDTVYHITTCEHFQKVLDGTMYGPYGEPGTATGYYCPCELSGTCPFVDDFDCGICKKRLAVFEDTVASFYIDDCETRVALDYSGSVDVSDFGKTVFPTREEAEAALKNREEAGNETD